MQWIRRRGGNFRPSAAHWTRSNRNRGSRHNVGRQIKCFENRSHSPSTQRHNTIIIMSCATYIYIYIYIYATFWYYCDADVRARATVSRTTARLKVEWCRKSSANAGRRRLFTHNTCARNGRRRQRRSSKNTNNGARLRRRSVRFGRSIDS